MKNTTLTLSFAFILTALAGCAEETAPPAPPYVDETTFEEITPDPRLVHTVTGCWFDNETLVLTEEGTENLCSVRMRGEDVSCSELCEASAFNVYDMCGSVSKCSALLWVDEENPLEAERGCWKCVDGCLEGLDRTPESYDACRPTEEMTPEETLD